MEAQLATEEEEWRKNLRGDFPCSGDRPLSWWTGKLPFAGLCPGVDEKGVLHSLLPPSLKTCSRQQILAYFDNSWTLTEVLFSSLQSEEAFYRPPYHRIRHPLIFYYLHPVVLYVNKLRAAGLLSEAVNLEFENLFATGVDEMSWDDLAKYKLVLPSLPEALAYRSEVYQRIKKIIETHPVLDQLPITPESSAWALFMGFEHERIHLETSSVLIRELPNHFVRRPPQWPEYYPLEKAVTGQPRAGTAYPSNRFISVPEGLARLGKPKEWPSYGWDNEYGEKNLKVKSFRAAQTLVSNGDFWQFVNSGGYQDQSNWTEEGWRWRCFRNIEKPTFWVPEGGGYQLRLLFDLAPMQWSWPVDVNYHEAKAYCSWLTRQNQNKNRYRLLTEAEHCRLRDPALLNPALNGAVAAGTQANINLAFGSETPVNASQPSAQNFYDVFGNLWQWSDDCFSPLPGFRTHSLYADFSTPCFDDQHQMIFGGSFVSTGDEASVWARFHFRPHFFQHAGFRLVEDDPLSS